MSSIRVGGRGSTSQKRQTIRCFAHVLSEAGTDDLARRVVYSLNNWEFDSFVMQSQPAGSHEEAVEHAKQARELYPESMHLIIGSSVLDGTRLREPLREARNQVGRGSLAIVHLGSSVSQSEVPLDGIIRTDNLRTEARRIVRMLHYRRPVGKSVLPCAPQSQRVTKRKDFTASLRLRFTVYDLMGYIPDQYRSTRTGLEMDNLDKYSLHYVCQLPGENNGQPAASLRLITRRRQRDSLRWVNQTLLENSDRPLKRSVRASQFQELPVFSAIQNLEEFQAMLQSEEAEYCELSRMVVDQPYRGMGLSRQLIELALADARRMGVRCVFLACVPEQVSMYEKYGFLHFPSDVVTFARVQQPAQALFQFL